MTDKELEKVALLIECPKCGAWPEDSCVDPEPGACSRCGYVGCREIDCDTHKARLEKARKLTSDQP
jgi:hypothetical protein